MRVDFSLQEAVLDFSSYYRALSEKQVRVIAANHQSQEDWMQSLTRQLSEGSETVPPLDQQIFPGDSVVLAVSVAVPQWHQIAATIVDWLGNAGISSEHISVVASSEIPLNPTMELTTGINWIGHQADNSEHSTMVGVSRHGEAIYLNSTVATADVVIPIVLAGVGDSADGYFYPGLSSKETQDRLQSDMHLLVEEANEAEKLVSPFFVVGVVTAPGDKIGEVLVDSRKVVDLAASQLLPNYWTTGVHQYDALVATGGTEGASIDYIGLWNAIRNTSQLVKPHGPVVLLANIVDQKRIEKEASETTGLDSEAPLESSDESLLDEEQELLDSMEFGQDDRESTETEFEEDLDSEDEESDDFDEVETESDDSDLSGEYVADGELKLTNKQARLRLIDFVEELRSQQPVFLVSNLKGSPLESLGFGELNSAEELENLLRGYDEVGLLQNADRWIVA